MDASNWMGSTVEVVRGRKIPVGTVGVVRWAKEGKWGWRVGLKVAGHKERGLVFVAAKNCEVREAGEQQRQGELFNAKAPAPEVVWFERTPCTDTWHVVAFDNAGNKLTHKHACSAADEARRLANRVKDSGKSWDDLRGSGHWLTGDAEVDLAHEQRAA